MNRKNYAVLKNMNNQSGSTLVLVMLALLAVTAVSIVAMRTGTLELDVATNDKFHKICFFAADGTNELVTELIEQNVELRGLDEGAYGKTSIATGSGEFFSNSEDTDTPANNIPSNTNYDVEVPDIGACRVYVKTYAGVVYIPGGSIIQASAYDGLGKSAAGGGAGMTFTVRSNANGPNNCVSKLRLGYLKLI